MVERRTNIARARARPATQRRLLQWLCDAARIYRRATQCDRKPPEKCRLMEPTRLVRRAGFATVENNDFNANSRQNKEMHAHSTAERRTKTANQATENQRQFGRQTSERPTSAETGSTSLCNSSDAHPHPILLPALEPLLFVCVSIRV